MCKILFEKQIYTNTYTNFTQRKYIFAFSASSNSLDSYQKEVDITPLVNLLDILYHKYASLRSNHIFRFS